MKITKRILAIVLALALTIGGVSVAASASVTQHNRVSRSNVFIDVDTNWVALDRAEAIDSTEARALQSLFNRFFRNDLIGLHITQSTSRVAIRPAEGIELAAVLYNAEANTFRRMNHIRVCSNGFWIFEVPENGQQPQAHTSPERAGAPQT